MPEAQAFHDNLEQDLAERVAQYERSPSLSVVITPADIKAAVAKLKRGRTIARGNVSAEMFQVLNDDAVGVLAVSMSVRASGGMETPPSWQHLRACLFPNIPRPRRVADLRPITIVPVCRKLFSFGLLEQIKPSLLSTLSSWSMGCRSGFQGLGLIQSLRSLVEKSHEWRLPLVLCKLDIRKACDTLSRRAIRATLREAGVAPPITLAFTRGLRELQLALGFSGVEGDPVSLPGGLLQGDPASPLLFSATMDRSLPPLVAGWKSANHGFHADSCAYPLFAWMDDLYTLADSLDDMQRMLTQATEACKTVGLLLQPTKCQWMANAAAAAAFESDGDPPSLIAEGKPLSRVEGVVGFQVLGTQLTMDANPWPEWNIRMARTWRAFWSSAPLLLNRRAHV